MTDREAEDDVLIEEDDNSMNICKWFERKRQESEDFIPFIITSIIASAIIITLAVISMTTTHT